MRVALSPAPPPEPDAYLRLLSDAAGRAGADAVPAPALSARWARSARRELDVVHLHWLEFIAPGEPGRLVGLARTLRRSLRLLSTLRTLSRGGVGIVWTVHNLAPHEPVHPRIEFLLSRSVMALCDRAIVHSAHAAERVGSHLGGREKIGVIPHGSYVGVYPSPGASRPRLRASYGLPEEAYVYLCFGQIRRYKRVPEVIRAFCALPGEDLALLIAGEPRDRAELKRIEAAAARDPRVHIDARRVPFEEVASVHAAADAAVFGFELFSSGSALLAVSCGLPVVAPARSAAVEIAGAPALEKVGAAGLTAALDAARQDDQGARRRAALAAAARFDWQGVGVETMQVYRDAAAEARNHGKGRRRVRDGKS